MADKPVRRLTSLKKPAPPAPAAAPPQAGYDPALGYDPSVVAQIPVLGATGKGFLPAGTVLTDFEAEGLRTLGHDPARPIPTDLAAKIAEAHAALQGPVPLPVPLDTPPLKIPTPVDVRTLPPEKQREIAESLRAAAGALAAPPADPSPRRPAAPPPPAAPVVEDDLRPGMTAAPPPPPPVTPSRPPEYDPPAAGGGLLHPAECPHCGYDLKKPDPTTPTDDDKLAFVQAVLGQQRFRKTYDLLGGRLRVTFRSLLTEESNTAFRQVVVDAQSDLKNRMVNDTPFYWRNLTSYRTVLALESVDSDQTGTIAVNPIGEIEVEPGAYAFPDTKLAAVHDAIVTQTMPTEHLQQIVGHCYNEFQALCDKLTVMAEDPNFFKAIG